MMRSLNRLIDWVAGSFGDLPFIATYNTVTFLWVYLGLTDKHFFDPFPSNFYTLTVSWLAINMSSLLLWNERRKSQKEREARDKKDADTMAILQALLSLAEKESDYSPILRQVMENQVAMLGAMEGMNKECQRSRVST